MMVLTEAFVSWPYDQISPALRQDIGPFDLKSSTVSMSAVAT